MSNPNMVAEKDNINLNTLIGAVVNRSCIVDFGIVTEVPEDYSGIVTVVISVANTAQDLKLMTCVLANMASSAIAVNIKPVVGDKVLVVYPRLYDEDMFTVDEANKTKVIVNEQARGYNMTGGIAFLFNQLQENTHHNLIEFKDGELSVKLAYLKDGDEEKNLLTFDTNKDGEISLNSNGNTVSLSKDGALSVGLAYSEDDEKNLLTIATDKDGAVTLQNPKSEVILDKDGYLSYSNTDDSKTHAQFTGSGMSLQDKNGNKINTSSSGMTIEDKNGCKIVSSSSDIKINNKLTIKK